MRRLLLPVLLGLIACGALAATGLHDLIEGHAGGGYLVQLGNPHLDTSGQFMVMRATSFHRTPASLSAAQWWRSTPTVVVAIAVLGLLIAALIVAARRGPYAPRTNRLLRIAGLVALIGGPIAALIAYLAPRFAAGDAISTTIWPQAVIWVVVGGGLLAVRDLLVRTGELNSELDGVI
jgi:hypothetical protein